jgi:imidazolonepropionase-like amidohydrolase
MSQCMPSTTVPYGMRWTPACNAASTPISQPKTQSSNLYRLAKKHGVKLAWGTDTLFDPALAEKPGKLVTKLAKWFTPFEALKMVTHDNAQLLKLSGPRDPYPGELGVVVEGALADLVLVNGNPLQNLNLVADPDKTSW